MEEYTLSRPSDEPGIQLNTIMENSDIKSRFEKEFGTRSDYFNHRLGLFMDMANWIEKQLADLRAERDNLLVAYKHAISRISELETERDKSFDGSIAMSKEIEELKSDNERMKNNEDYKELVEEVIRLRAENERLKEKLETNVENWTEFKFTSELQRRWPSEIEIYDALNTFTKINEFIEWLKSYLENK